MKKNSSLLMAFVLSFAVLVIPLSCKKEQEISSSQNLSFTFPRLTVKHNKYLSIDYDARSIELLFDQPLEATTIIGCVELTHKGGSLAGNFDLKAEGNILWMDFHDGFSLIDGWKYNLTIKSSLLSTTGKSLKHDTVVELRTTSSQIGGGAKVKGNKQRTLIACISDIHMGDPRANQNHYSWFGKNAKALTDFLNFVNTDPEVKEVVIMGDLFDEWLVPYNVNPFDPLEGINSSADYFNAIATYTDNVPIINQLKAIANNPEVDLIYVQGNHDMLLDKTTLEGIIPGIIWKGDVTGIGKYVPAEGIVMEHGHRYDFFNCPQPLVNPGHMLPPGYFVSRMYAAGMEHSGGKNMSRNTPMKSAFEFNTAWNLAMIYTLADFHMDMPDLNATNILMGGIDGYTSPLSFSGAQAMYANNIEDLWPQTQTVNQVPIPMNVFSAIFNGTELYDAALIEYMQTGTGNQQKIVAFGHSHNPEILVHPPLDYTCIYANTGSWIDGNQTKNPVRTFLTIEPGAWSGSDLDIVMLYEHNPVPDSGSLYKPQLLSEESIDE